MTVKSSLARMREKMKVHSMTDENADVAVMSAIMDELSGTAPPGTAEKVAERQHRRTGYIFPSDPEFRALLNGEDSEK